MNLTYGNTLTKCLLPRLCRIAAGPAVTLSILHSVILNPLRRHYADTTGKSSLVQTHRARKGLRSRPNATRLRIVGRGRVSRKLPRAEFNYDDYKSDHLWRNCDMDLVKYQEEQCMKYFAGLMAGPDGRMDGGSFCGSTKGSSLARLEIESATISRESDYDLLERIGRESLFWPHRLQTIALLYMRQRSF